jgi:hypothetical protein
MLCECYCSESRAGESVKLPVSTPKYVTYVGALGLRDPDTNAGK